MRASSIFSQTPRSRHRQKRRCVFFQSPRSGGKSRHGAPVLSIQKTALINNRLSAEGRPTEPLEPGRSFSIFAHTLSEISCLRCAAIWSLLIVRACLETSAFIVTRRHVDKKGLCAAAKTREDCQTVPQRSDGQRMGACTSSPAPCFWRRSEAQNRPA